MEVQERITTNSWRCLRLRHRLRQRLQRRRCFCLPFTFASISSADRGYSLFWFANWNICCKSNLRFIVFVNVCGNGYTKALAIGRVTTDRLVKYLDALQKYRKIHLPK